MIILSPVYFIYYLLDPDSRIPLGEEVQLYPSLEEIAWRDKTLE